MKHLKTVLMLLLATSSFTSCKKDEGTEKKDENSSIEESRKMIMGQWDGVLVRYRQKDKNANIHDSGDIPVGGRYGSPGFFIDFFEADKHYDYAHVDYGTWSYNFSRGGEFVGRHLPRGRAFSLYTSGDSLFVETDFADFHVRELTKNKLVLFMGTYLHEEKRVSDDLGVKTTYKRIVKK